MTTPPDGPVPAPGRSEPRPKLGRAVAAYLDRFAQDPSARPDPCDAREQFIILRALVRLGELPAARAFVAGTVGSGGVLSGLDGLRTLVAGMPPRDVGDRSGPDFVDDPDRDVQLVRRPGAGTVLMVFTGGVGGFGGPLPLVHEWFRRLDASIVYLRDPLDLFYLAGLPSLGGDLPSAVAGLRAIAGSLSAERILCIGTSAGGYAALRYGLDLAAERVLSLSGPTVIDESVGLVEERGRLTGRDTLTLDPELLDIAALYRAVERRPLVRLLFGGDNENDRDEAERMAGIDGVERIALPGVSDHGILSALVERTGFEAQLAWLTDGVGAAGRHSERPSTSVSPSRSPMP